MDTTTSGYVEVIGNYPDDKTAEVDLEINADLVDTRGAEDEPVNQ